jgi:hypothetical protein
LKSEGANARAPRRFRITFRMAATTARESTGVHSESPHLASPDENPSFIKGLFLGEIREDLLFPFPQLSADE